MRLTSTLRTLLPASTRPSAGAGGLVGHPVTVTAAAIGLPVAALTAAPSDGGALALALTYPFTPGWTAAAYWAGALTAITWTVATRRARPDTAPTELEDLS